MAVARHAEHTPAFEPGATGDALSNDILKAEIAAAYRPVIRGFMLPVAVFYGLVIAPNFYLSPLPTAVSLSIPAALTVLLAIAGFIYLRPRPVEYGKLEVLGALIALMIFINCCKLVYVDYNPLNLIYFLLLLAVSMAVAISSRLVITICVVCVVTTLGIAYEMGAPVLTRIVFGVLAGGLAAAGLSILTRSAVMKSVKARLVADRLRKRAEIQADFDSLCGLPNRRHFFSVIDGLLEKRVCRADVGIIDLDGFKPVNDLYGHAIGDELLVEVAKRLRLLCPAPDFVARLGGDEFALIVQRDLDEAKLRKFGLEINEALREPFTIAGIPISISASIGFTHVNGSQTIREIYERADHALYRAKRDARGEVVIFQQEHEAELSDIGRYEQALRTADLPREITVVFQPQHDLMTGRTSGFEALARWNSPTLGQVNPGQFIAAAERTGVMERVTGVVVQKSLTAAQSWPAEIGVSINLSVLDLTSSRSITNIVGIIAESGIDPRRVTFEITETTIMSDFESARTSLETLAALGCRIALDDFGSGYSSFAYIHRFPLHRIKTDRCFVTMRNEDAAVSATIFRAITDLCNHLGVECLAEGIETESELLAVRDAGVRYIQGYYFGRPMSASAVSAHITEQRQVA